MKTYDLYDRIYGSLLTAALGDALGGPSETQSKTEILKNFGGRIETFYDGLPYDRNALCEVTDDTSQMYEMGKAVIQTDGELTVEAAAAGIVSWADNYPRFYPRCAGPTTRYIVDALKAGEDPVELGKKGLQFQRGTSNGAVMRIAAAGLVNPGNWEGAVQTAVTMTKPSHGTQQAFSASSAVACAIAEAMTEHSTIHSVLRAAVYGARRGEEIGLKEGRIAPGGRVYTNLIEAIEIAFRSRDVEEVERMLDESVGANICTARASVPITIGLFAANHGDGMGTIISCANVGGDTDTIGCMAGMIAGAFSGTSGLREDWCRQLKETNPDFDLEWMARELTRIAKRRGGIA